MFGQLNVMPDAKQDIIFYLKSLVVKYFKVCQSWLRKPIRQSGIQRVRLYSGRFQVSKYSSKPLIFWLPILLTLHILLTQQLIVGYPDREFKPYGINGMWYKLLNIQMIDASS